MTLWNCWQMPFIPYGKIFTNYMKFISPSIHIMISRWAQLPISKFTESISPSIYFRIDYFPPIFLTHSSVLCTVCFFVVLAVLLQFVWDYQLLIIMSFLICMREKWRRCHGWISSHFLLDSYYNIVIINTQSTQKSGVEMKLPELFSQS